MKIFRSLLLLLVVIAIILFFTFDNIVKSVISEQGSKSLKTPISIASVESSFTNKSMEMKLIEVQNLSGFKSKNALKIESFTTVLGEKISDDLIDVDSIIIDGVVATLEQNTNGINIKMLTDSLDDKNNSEELINKDNDEEKIDINIKNISINNAKFIIDTQILKEEITLPNLSFDNIKADSENVSAVIIKILLDEVQEIIKKKGINIAKDKLEKALTRKISENIGLEGDTLDSFKEQAKEKTNDIKDKFKNMFNFK
jgi:protein-tyrosine-phosphatase